MRLRWRSVRPPLAFCATAESPLLLSLPLASCLVEVQAGDSGVADFPPWMGADVVSWLRPPGTGTDADRCTQRSTDRLRRTDLCVVRMQPLG